MKKIFIILAIIGLVACNSDDDSGDVDNNQFEEVITTLPQGKWYISDLREGDAINTLSFESFVFTFNEDGSVVAQNDLLSESGTWLYDNTIENTEMLTLQFTNTDPFDEINFDWNIESVSNTQVELSETSGGDGNEKYLTFTKL